MKKIKEFETIQYPNTLIIGVQTPHNYSPNINSYFEEFRNLIKSNDVVYEHETYIKLRSIDPAHFFTKGKLHDLIKLCESNEIEEIIISESLSNQQKRNLQKLLHADIYDRTELILEIFEKGATTAEGKLQVAIAMLQHKKSRLAGRGSSMSQQRGGIGAHRGPGETQKESEMRHIEQSIRKLIKDLKSLEKARATQRKQRLNKGIPHVSLIGYTNAGKSTILNALTKSDVLAEDKLFATLDTTTRELFIGDKKKGIISDTVGFIQQLPHKLIEAFKSTLSELTYSDLLLNVIDISDPNWQNHIEVVQEILEELNVNKDILYVFNKVDSLTPEHHALQKGFGQRYQPHVFISAHSKEGIEPLKNYLKTWSPSKK